MRLGALGYREFRLLWFGLILSNTGSWMQMLAQGWLVVELANSPTLGPFYLGLVGFVRAMPVLALSGLAGALADRMDRRRLLVITQTVMATAALGLGALVALHVVRIWHVMIIAAISSAAAAFDAPTRQSLVPLLVGKEDLMNAIGLNSAAFNGPAVIGPALGGIAVSTVGLPACFFINGFSFIAVLAALGCIAPKPPIEVASRTGIWKEVGDGIRYVRGNRVVLAIIGLSAILAVIARPYIQLLPAFAKSVTGGGPKGLGILMAAAGAGALMGSITTALMGIRRGRGLVFILSAGVAGIALTLFSFTRSMPASAAMLLLLGGAIMMFMGMSNTLLQTYTPLDMRGRVMSMYTMIFLGFMPLGSWLLGTTASITSLPKTFAVAGVAIVAAAVVALRRRDLRDLV